MAAEYALEALRQQRPELFQHGLFLLGESYGAQWVALLADRILKTPVDKRLLGELRGVLIGNGYVDPPVQRRAVAEKLRWTGVLAPGTKQSAQLDRIRNACVHDNTAESCDRIFQFAQALGGKSLSLYDYINRREPYARERKRIFFNRDDVREALGVPKHDGTNETVYIEKSARVKHALHTVLMDSALAELHNIVDAEVPLLLYFGALDLRDGIEGAMLYLDSVDTLKPLTEAPQRRWYATRNDVPAGHIHEHGAVSIAQIDDASHLAPAAQPRAALALAQAFVRAALSGKEDADVCDTLVCSDAEQSAADAAALEEAACGNGQEFKCKPIVAEQIDVRELPVDWTLLCVVAIASFFIGVSVAAMLMRLRARSAGMTRSASANGNDGGQSLLSRFVARSDEVETNHHRL